MIRCEQCQKLLAVKKKPVHSGALEIKCPRCGHINRAP